MTKVIAGDIEFESIDDYVAALEAWEAFRAPFKTQAEALVDEFIDYLHEQGLSRPTINKHGRNIGIFIVYLTQYTDADDFATVRKGVVNTEFFRWYRRKVLNRCDPASLQSTTKKFFKFLAEKKDLYNENVLGKRTKGKVEAIG
jgi:site-specific recombinase XerD